MAGITFLQLTKVLDSIAAAQFLQHCGGPYPRDELIVVVESQERALGSVSGAVLDATPHSTLERLEHAAIQAGRSRLTARAGFLGRLRLRRNLQDAEKSIRCAVQTSISSCRTSMQLARADATVIVEHVSRLFFAAWLASEAGHLDSLPVLARARDICLAGYLPIDVQEERGVSKLIVH